VTPTIGRIVHYHVGTEGQDVLPAIITKVHNATCVDLEVFGVGGYRLPTSVIQGDGPSQWSWPPRN
jgi:hypothetical protein